MPLGEIMSPTDVKGSWRLGPPSSARTICLLKLSVAPRGRALPASPAWGNRHLRAFILETCQHARPPGLWREVFAPG
jgi:hypothetical protein